MLISRRETIRRLAAAGAWGTWLSACGDSETRAEAPAARDVAAPPAELTPGERRLHDWVRQLRSAGRADTSVPIGETVVAVGELALGTPYRAHGLESYLLAGGDPMRTEPLTLSLDYFDCVSLVETCVAVARVTRSPAPPTWEAFATEMERMRYRGGDRRDYLSRLHYFSEWIDDNAQRGLVHDMGEEWGGVPDRRPLRFMTEHRDAYPALENPDVFQRLQELERSLDSNPRWVIPTARIPAIYDRLEDGDILAFATSIDGLDVTHAALTYRGDGAEPRVLHAPLSGGVVEITDSTVAGYVSGIRRSTGILVARPLDGNS